MLILSAVALQMRLNRGTKGHGGNNHWSGFALEIKLKIKFKISPE